MAAFASVTPALGATVSTPIALAACPTAVAADAAGNVQLLTRTQAHGHWRATISTVDGAGVVTPGLAVGQPWRAPNKVRSVFSGDGITVAYEQGNRPEPEVDGVALAGRARAAAARMQSRRHPIVAATTITGAGIRTSQVLSDPSRRAELDEIGSRGGTTVISFRQTVPHKLWLQEWIAVRPAGATRFLPAVSLASKLRDKFSSDEVYLGPDGSGVVVSVPDSGTVVARRITKDGRVGRALTVFPGAYPHSLAAVGPSGEIVVATVDGVRTPRGVEYGLFVSPLAPGAPAFSKPRLQGSEPANSDFISSGLTLAIDSSGEIAATSGREYEADGKTFATAFIPYRGRGDQLTAAPAIPAVSYWDPVMTPVAGGGMALTWRGFAIVDAKRDISTTAQYVSFRDADGTWSAPQTISPPFIWEPGGFATDKGVVALPQGGIAMAYAIERPGHHTRCSLVRATP